VFVNSAVRGTWPPIRTSRLHMNIGYWLHHVRKLNSQLNWSLRASNRVFGNRCALQSSSYVESLFYIDATRHRITVFGVHDYGFSVVEKFTFLGRTEFFGGTNKWNGTQSIAEDMGICFSWKEKYVYRCDSCLIPVHVAG